MTSPRKEILAEGIELWLGDAREVVRDLQGEFVVVGDPPYGISAMLGMGGGGKGDGGMWADVAIAGDEDTSVRDIVLALADAPYAVLSAVRIPAPPGAIATVCWDKGEHTGAGDLRLPWKPSFELVHIGGEGWTGERRIGGIVRINAVAGCVGNRNDGHRWHPFEKPVALMEHFIERAPPGRIVDPWCGSGTTGVAAIRLGRPFLGIDSDPLHFDIACRRLSAALGGPLRISAIQEALL